MRLIREESKEKPSRIIISSVECSDRILQITYKLCFDIKKNQGPLWVYYTADLTINWLDAKVDEDARDKEIRKQYMGIDQSISKFKERNEIAEALNKKIILA